MIRLNRGILAESLCRIGLHHQQGGSPLRELVCIQAKLTTPGAGSSQEFLRETRAKQGVVETPDEFNILVEFVVELVVSGRSAAMASLLEMGKLPSTI